MYEAIPIAAGLVVGYFASRMTDTRMRNIMIGVLSIIIGVIASTIAGEEWFFIPFDIFQAALGTVVGLVLSKKYLSSGNR
jgi:uncharacterized membrane protein YqgA involved in biofilm formation